MPRSRRRYRAGGRAERGRRRLLRRASRYGDGPLDAGDRRRLRQGPPRGRRDGAGAPHAARGGDERPVARRRCSGRCTRRCAASRRRGPVHRLPRDASRRAPTRRALTVALAGHPPPLLIDADGECAAGRPSRARCSACSTRSTSTRCDVELRAGETLLLYTDGRARGRARRGGSWASSGLLELCRKAPRARLAGLLERIEDAALERAEGAARRHRAARLACARARAVK